MQNNSDKRSGFTQIPRGLDLPRMLWQLTCRHNQNKLNTGETKMSKTPMTLNVTEQNKLLEALLNKDAPHKSFRKGIRNYLIGCLMLEAGLRVGEVIKLLKSDLFFAGQYVKTLVIRSEIAKNKTERTIPVSTRLANALEKYAKDDPDFYLHGPSYIIFSRADLDGCITTRQVERIIRTAGMKALGRPVHPHMLRHTFATKLMRVTDMRTVQELLGHSDITSTQIYTHPNEDDKKKAISNLEITNSPLSGTV